MCWKQTSALLYISIKSCQSVKLIVLSLEKTLLLLFKGAKKCCPQEVTHSEHAALTTTDKQDKMKQLFIGKDGTLLHSGKMVNWQ